jgi:hypothetical protein
MKRSLLIVAFAALLLADLAAVSQTLALLGLALAFGAVGHGGMWLPIALSAVALTGALIWLTTVTWRALGASSRGRPTTR